MVTPLTDPSALCIRTGKIILLSGYSINTESQELGSSDVLISFLAIRQVKRKRMNDTEKKGARYEFKAVKWVERLGDVTEAATAHAWTPP